MKLCKLLLLVFTSMLMNCAYLQLNALLNEQYSVEEFILPVGIHEVKIIDTRRVVDDREIKISWFALPGDRDETFPKLKEAHRQVIMGEIDKYLNKNRKDTITMLVEIVEGIEKYTCSWIGEDLLSKSSIRITLLDQLHQPYLITTGGEATYTFKSGIATKNVCEKLYQKSIKMAIYKSMESIKKAYREDNIIINDKKDKGI